MSGFRRAKAEQAALKIGLYGDTGSGKTFTALLLAEGLAKISGKRIAFVDTENGTHFYCQAVSQRRVHPEAFEFDALYTRSITEIGAAIRSINPSEHAVVVIDSITHLWESARAAYDGRQTKAGTIPITAWGKIKRPYLDIIGYLISSPLHVLICGRQATEWETDEETGEMKNVGVKMRAEGQSAYEMHILLHMESVKPKKANVTATIIAYAEKDRTGILAGRLFENPTFETLCTPLLGLLGPTQAKIQTTDEVASIDSEAMATEEANRGAYSTKTLETLRATIVLCKTAEDLKAIGKAITSDVKAAMLPADVAALREAYLIAEERLAK